MRSPGTGSMISSVAAPHSHTAPMMRPARRRSCGVLSRSSPYWSVWRQRRFTLKSSPALARDGIALLLGGTNASLNGVRSALLGGAPVRRAPADGRSGKRCSASRADAVASARGDEAAGVHAALRERGAVRGADRVAQAFELGLRQIVCGAVRVDRGL